MRPTTAVRTNLTLKACTVGFLLTSRVKIRVSNRQLREVANLSTHLYGLPQVEVHEGPEGGPRSARLELGTETAIHVAATWSVFLKLSRLFTLLCLDVQGTDEG